MTMLQPGERMLSISKHNDYLHRVLDWIEATQKGGDREYVRECQEKSDIAFREAVLEVIREDHPCP